MCSSTGRSARRPAGRAWPLHARELSNWAAARGVQVVRRAGPGKGDADFFVWIAGLSGGSDGRSPLVVRRASFHAIFRSHSGKRSPARSPCQPDGQADTWACPPTGAPAWSRRSGALASGRAENHPAPSQFADVGQNSALNLRRETKENGIKLPGVAFGGLTHSASALVNPSTALTQVGLAALNAGDELGIQVSLVFEVSSAVAASTCLESRRKVIFPLNLSSATPIEPLPRCTSPGLAGQLHRSSLHAVSACLEVRVKPPSSSPSASSSSTSSHGRKLLLPSMRTCLQTLARASGRQDDPASHPEAAVLLAGNSERLSTTSRHHGAPPSRPPLPQIPRVERCA